MYSIGFIKTSFLLFSSFIQLNTSGQSPYLTVFVKMDSTKAEGTRYKIEMKICEIKKSERGEWFTHDTSKINFAALQPDDLGCGEYFHNGLPTLIAGHEEKKPVNQFEFGNQFFAWEHIFVYRISNMSSRGWNPEMYIVVPVKYKSFRTRIEINDIEFQSGKVIFLTDLEGTYDEKQLVLAQSLKTKKGLDVKNFSLRSILVEK